MTNQPRVAVLIDADNIAASLCDKVLKTCEKFGNVIVKRAFGDFTKGTAATWQNTIITHAIEMNQNYNVAANKNASDISLVIDAMDLLHNLQIDTFCIISSDSDFTRLATRLTSSERKIYGFGEGEKTSDSFKNACTKFHSLTKSVKTVSKKNPAISPCTHQIAQKLNAGSDKPYLKAYNFIRKELKKLTLDKKWIKLDSLGQQISDTYPKIKYSDYGGKTLSKVVKLVEKTTLIETKGLATKDAKLRLIKVAS